MALGKKNTRSRISRKEKLAIDKWIRLSSDEKYLDVPFPAVTAAATYTIAPLTAVPQGNAQSQRIADKIMPLRFEARGYVYSATAMTQSTAMRLVLFRFKPNNAAGSFPISNTTIFGPNIAGGAAPDVHSFYNYSNRDIFVVKKDLFFPIGIQTGFEGHRNVSDLACKCDPVPIVFTPAATTGADEYFLAYASDSIANLPVLDLFIRFWYADA
jgi:hypothetical protein